MKSQKILCCYLFLCGLKKTCSFFWDDEGTLSGFCLKALTHCAEWKAVVVCNVLLKLVRVVFIGCFSMF